MKYYVPCTIYPRPNTGYGERSFLSVPYSNADQFETEQWNQNLEFPLPCASITYQITPVLMVPPVVDLAYSMRNPRDRWDRKEGRALSKERFKAYMNGSLVANAFSFSLKDALLHSFPSEILSSFDKKIMFSMQSPPIDWYGIISWKAINDFAIDYAGAWIDFLFRKEYRIVHLVDIFRGTRTRHPETFDERMKLIRNHAHFPDEDWNTYIQPAIEMSKEEEEKE